MATYRANGDKTFDVWNDSTQAWDVFSSTSGWANISTGATQVEVQTQDGELSAQHSVAAPTSPRGFKVKKSDGWQYMLGTIACWVYSTGKCPAIFEVQDIQ